MRSSARGLARALRLAERGRFTVAPNPRVGAVVVDADGATVGEGWHARAGEAHAEALALAAAGDRARGGTLYLNLEPCAHQGRTPPCADAVVAAGIARVVACHLDPDPRVAGRGFARLAAAGVTVEVGELSAEAIRLNLPFLVERTLGRPEVTLKWAMSLDGKIATATGASRWISGAAARRWALELREEHDAILVGSGTLVADDPRLDRRLGKARGPILRVVLDRRLRTPDSARCFEVEGPIVLYTESAVEESPTRAAARAALERRRAEVVQLTRVDPQGVLADLARRGVQSVLVEGGAEVAASFVESGLVDRVAVACAGLVLGGRGAPGAVGGTGAAALADGLRVRDLRARRRGDDWIWIGETETCLQALSAKLASS